MNCHDVRPTTAHHRDIILCETLCVTEVPDAVLDGGLEVLKEHLRACHGSNTEVLAALEASGP